MIIIHNLEIQIKDYSKVFTSVDIKDNDFFKQNS